jgi:hypothetical protein
VFASDILDSHVPDLLAEIGELETIIQNYEHLAPVPQTGQTISYFDYDDGYYHMDLGVTWLNPRFTENEDMIMENLTGLMWLKDANCIATNYPSFDNDGVPGDGKVTWQHALDFVAGINDGTYSECGVGFTDLRLPNIKELLSLINYNFSFPCLSNTVGTNQLIDGDPFINFVVPAVYVGENDYWSSTSDANGPISDAWMLNFIDGQVIRGSKTVTNYVWPIRGPG